MRIVTSNHYSHQVHRGLRNSGKRTGALRLFMGNDSSRLASSLNDTPKSLTAQKQERLLSLTQRGE
jgi:hypothetical protein